MVVRSPRGTDISRIIFHRCHVKPYVCTAVNAT